MRTISWFIVLLLGTQLLACAGAIAELPEQEELSAAELKAALTGDDFRAKTAAREQLGKLDPAARVALLKELLQEKDAPTRMLALSELLNLPEETWRPILTDVAQNDPDEEVRELAAMALEE